MDDIEMLLRMEHNLFVMKSLALGENLDRPAVIQWRGREKELLEEQQSICQYFAVVRGYEEDYYAQTLGYAGVMAEI